MRRRRVEPGLGFEAGQAVTVAATDYGADPVAGTLVGLSQTKSVLRRIDARAGTVHVHFPRIGFQIKAEKRMKRFKGRTAVITGAASGFGLESSRIAAREGMNVVMADVQADALDRAAAEIGASGAPVLAFRLDVAKAAEVEALGAATLAALRRAALRLQQRRRRLPAA